MGFKLWYVGDFDLLRRVGLLLLVFAETYLWVLILLAWFWVSFRFDLNVWFNTEIWVLLLLWSVFCGHIVLLGLSFGCGLALFGIMVVSLILIADSAWVYMLIYLIFLGSLFWYGLLLVLILVWLLVVFVGGFCVLDFILNFYATLCFFIELFVVNGGFCGTGFCG